MKSLITPSILALLAAVTPARADATPVLKQLAARNVVWDSPSADMHGSMPIGNGDLAANFWVEPSGDLVFYLSKSDSWDADQELLKLGRVRIRLDKPFVRDGRPFRQELDLARGCIVVESGVGEDKTTVDFWIDANRPVVNVQIKGAEAFTAQVALEHWPKETYGNRPTQSTDIAKTNTAATPEALRGDTILPTEDNTIRWYYRNTESIFADTLKNQHLGHAVEKFQDPLLNLTFGGLIAGKGLVTKDERTLATVAPLKSLDIRIHALTAQTPEAAAWVSQLDTLRAANEKVAAAEARPAHEQWWKDFWNRSWIFPEGTEEAKAVGRAYALQRWIQAGAARGAYPIKFNGSLFTVDGFMDKKGDLKEFGPDWRRWGGCFWFQNLREPYWAMLYSGDYDQMEPLWKMYREAVPMLQERTKTYFKHDGIFCSETIHPWGLNKLGDFGNNNPEFYPTNPFIRRYWDSGIELSQIMLDRYAHAPSEAFAKNTMIPIADGVVTFYEQHYPKPESGKPRFAPAMSLETWHTAEDPLPVIVGLRTVLTRLLELPDSLSAPEQRAKWSRFLAELPETPMAEEKGKKWMLPARTFSDKRNSENPELYAGTHFNPNVTWWNQAAGPWIGYLNRCQALLQSGLFAADVLYYNGDGAPNLVDAKHVPAGLGKGYDYDVCNEEVLLTRLSVRDGKIVLPDGMSYRVLVLPNTTKMPAPVAQKLRELVQAGATVIGPKPLTDPGLKNHPQCDEEVKKIGEELWSGKTGKGRVFEGKTEREVLLADGVLPDFEAVGTNDSFIDFIHRTTPEAEIYFLANRKDRPEKVSASFRQTGRQPELWNPVNGEQRDLPNFKIENGRTSIPLDFDPHGSMFVVFRKPTTATAGEGSNFPSFETVQTLEGPWSVQFDKEWFYPTAELQGEAAEGKLVFEKLEDWSKRPEEAVKHFSGTATYRKKFPVSALPSPGSKLFLDLGNVSETAKVTLNGKDLGVLWCGPRRVDITEAIKPGENELEIEVVNNWPNRLIGDAKPPNDQRRTRTNIVKYNGEHPLQSSGLLGPVTIFSLKQTNSPL